MSDDRDLTVHTTSGHRVLTGHIDGVIDGSVVGWAVWRYPESGKIEGGVALRVLADGNEIAATTASIERQDVQSEVGGDGAFGFAFAIPVKFLDGQRHPVWITAESGGDILTNQPFELQMPVEAKPTVQQLVSSHINIFSEVAGFHDTSEILSLLQDNASASSFVTDICEVFPSYTYRKTAPLETSIADPIFRKNLENHFEALNQRESTVSSTRLVLLSHVYICNTQIHHIEADRVLTIYETARPPDRPFTSQPQWTPQTLRREALNVIDPAPILYLGSAGFRNYGHWLTDDLPLSAALDAVATHCGSERIKIAAPGTGPALNAAKLASLLILQPKHCTDEILFIPHEKPVFFKQVYYVTPSSYHPVVKSPDACRYLRNGIPAQNSVHDKRIFVIRQVERGRNITNQDNVIKLAIEFGFDIVDVEAFDFLTQAQMFQSCSIVMGCMGAAMANTVFCSEDTEVIYLAPNGWMEPYYWDLATVCGHNYVAVYGEASGPSAETHMTNFTIDIGALRPILARSAARESTRRN